MIQKPRKRKEIAFFDRRLLWLCIKMWQIIAKYAIVSLLIWKFCLEVGVERDLYKDAQREGR